jgi:DNA-binding transcriptional regulator YhcF (GntR family)
MGVLPVYITARVLLCASVAQLGTQSLNLSVDRNSDLSPGLQLSWRLRALFSSGRLAPGERLPSVRELATRAGVNVNTARAVYRRLEREGLVVSRHGLGTFVAERAEIAAPQVERLAAEAAAEAREAGVDPRELATAIYAAAGIGPGDAETPTPVSSTLPDLDRGDEAATRRELRRQIARLEEELSGYARELRRGDPGHPLLQAKPRVADVSELERTRDELLEQIAKVRDRQARKGRRQERARRKVEEMARRPEENKWQWVSNEETGDPGCKTWHVTPRYGPVGALMGWWRVKVSSGCPLARGG